MHDRVGVVIFKVKLLGLVVQLSTLEHVSYKPM
jgi:hypothetical protein